MPSIDDISYLVSYLLGISQLSNPIPADTFTGVLDNVSISFGLHADRIEWLLLELINRENCFQFNKPPNDKSVEKLEILERRLRVVLGGCYNRNFRSVFTMALRS